MTETYYDPHADWTLIPDHMRGAVERYVMHGIPGGSFLNAIVSGAPLTEVVARADDANQNALKGWASFIYNCAPSPCHGSPDKVTAWIASGGVLGRAAARTAA